MKKKKKYNTGGVLSTAQSLAPMANMAMPGLGSALSTILSVVNAGVQKKELNKQIEGQFNKQSINTNPFGFALGGMLKGKDDLAVYKGKSHKYGGILTNTKGIPTKDGINEVEGNETKFKFKGNEYIFSDKLVI